MAVEGSALQALTSGKAYVSNWPCSCMFEVEWSSSSPNSSVQLAAMMYAYSFGKSFGKSWQ